MICDMHLEALNSNAEYGKSDTLTHIWQLHVPVSLTYQKYICFYSIIKYIYIKPNQISNALNSPMVISTIVLHWNLYVTTTCMMKFIICDLFSNVL